MIHLYIFDVDKARPIFDQDVDEVFYHLDNPVPLVAFRYAGREHRLFCMPGWAIETNPAEPAKVE